MDLVEFRTSPGWWGPKLSPLAIRLLRPLRLRMQRRVQRLLEIEVCGLENLRGAVDAGHGVLITPNHSGHADTFILYHAADLLRRPLYFMAAWQVLGLVNPFRRAALRWHGCFSVDREGTDLKAFKQATEILQSRPHPLVIFPEGEVYHINERVTPFREGPATIALAAARRAKRPVVCVPCGIRYFYTTDPTPDLLQVMERLEREILWRPTPDIPLERRIYRFAEAMLALKELEHLGRTSAGSLPERVAALSNAILSRLEERYAAAGDARTTPERVKTLRQHAIKTLEESTGAPAEADICRQHLDDLHLVVQLFSYPGDYVAEHPSIERMAETLDKFEEDVLRRRTATIRGARRAVVSFGEPIEIDGAARRKDAGVELTRRMESAVQALLDGVAAPASDRIQATH